MEKRARIEAIYELSIRGVGGEKENAQRLLEHLCKKYNIDINSLGEEQKDFYDYECKDIFEKRLLNQIVSFVIDVNHPTLYYHRKGKNKGNILVYQITKKQHLEIKYLFGIYSEALKTEFDNVLNAFIQKNDIFCSDSKSDPGDYDPKEIEKLMRYMATQEKIVVNKAIEHIL
jgi:CRISPR/Cas system-associated protein endoribonuclease Cas2